MTPNQPTDKNAAAEIARQSELQKNEENRRRIAEQKRLAAEAERLRKNQLQNGPETFETLATKLKFTHDMLVERRERQFFVGVGTVILSVLIAIAAIATSYSSLGSAAAVLFVLGLGKTYAAY
jgi:type IV secretory pathway VirB10-like protein